MEYKIIKKGRKGFIKPLPPKALAKSIEAKLSYQKQGAHFMPNPAWAQVKLYKIKSGSFPWGLKDTVISTCEDWESFNPDDTFTVCRLFLMVLNKGNKRCSSKNLRSYQKEAVDALVRHNGGILSIPTGGGKTFTCLSYLELYQQPTLVIVPTIYLVEQWKKQSPDYVDVRTYQGIKDYKELDKYKFIVIDEVHIGSIGTIYKICMKLKEQTLICLSATPYRIDGETMKMIGACGRIVFKITLQDLIKQGYLCDAIVDEVNLKNHIPEFYIDYHGYYQNYIVDNQERNDKIIEKCLVDYRNNKIILLVDRIEHGEYLQSKLEGRAVFWNSKNLERDIDSPIIIGTSLLDQGVDLPERDVIILGGGGKSSIKVLQRIGRVLRIHPNKKKAIIVNFIDRCKYLYEHYKERDKVLKENGFEKKDKELE